MSKWDFVKEKIGDLVAQTYLDILNGDLPDNQYLWFGVPIPREEWEERFGEPLADNEAKGIQVIVNAHVPLDKILGQK